MTQQHAQTNATCLGIFIRLWINADPDNMRLFIPFALIGVLSGLLSGVNLLYATQIFVENFT